MGTSVRLVTLKRTMRFLTLLLVVQMFISGTYAEKANAFDKTSTEVNVKD